MLTGIKVSSLASKCICYRPKHKANREPLKWNFKVLGMQRLDKPTDRAQRVDKKMGLKCLKNGKNHVCFQSYGY